MKVEEEIQRMQEFLQWLHGIGALQHIIDGANRELERLKREAGEELRKAIL